MKPFSSYLFSFPKYRSYYFILWALIFIFTLRVLGQWIQGQSPVPWLPPLDQWQGSNTPYWLLLSIQLSIISLMIYVTYSYHHGKAVINRQKGRVLLGIGLVYFFTMFSRLFIGLLNLTELSWFNRAIPAFFHLVLATYLILLATYHFQQKLQGNVGNAGD